MKQFFYFIGHEIFIILSSLMTEAPENINEMLLRLVEILAQQAEFTSAPG